MTLLALILFIVAAVLFAVAALGVAARRANLVAAGLCVFIAAYLCQYLVHGALVQ